MTGEQDASPIPFCAPYDPTPRASAWTLPRGACDCHVHIVGPADTYPFAAGRSYTPHAASLEAYRHLMTVLGLERAVIVQPSFYGDDNRATLDAVAEAGDAFRSIVVTDSDVGSAELKDMHALGVRGVRLNLLFPGAAPIADLPGFGRKLADAGLHLEFLVDVSTIDAATWKILNGLPCETVFAHLGHVSVVHGTKDPGFRALLALLEKGRSWVKLSGPYRITAEPAPPYADVTPFARALADCNSERLVWGSDWPHPQIPVQVPNDGALANLMLDWVPNAEVRTAILTRNAARLYGFSDV